MAKPKHDTEGVRYIDANPQDTEVTIWTTNGAAIYAAMAAALADFPAVTKARENRGEGFKYRGIDDAYTTAHPILAKHKIFLRTTDTSVQFLEASPTQRGAPQVRVYYFGLLHFVSGKDGSSISTDIHGEAVDTRDRGLNKARSNAMKYAIWETFSVAPDEAEDVEKEGEPDDAPPDWKSMKKDDMLRFLRYRLANQYGFSKADGEIVNNFLKVNFGKDTVAGLKLDQAKSMHAILDGLDKQGEDVRNHMITVVTGAEYSAGHQLDSKLTPFGIKPKEINAFVERVIGGKCPDYRVLSEDQSEAVTKVVDWLLETNANPIFAGMFFKYAVENNLDMTQGKDEVQRFYSAWIESDDMLPF